MKTLRRAEGSGRTDPEPAISPVAGGPERPDAGAGVELCQEVRAVGAELDLPGGAEGHVRDGGAGGRVPEPDAVGVGRGQEATVAAEVEGAWTPVIRAG